MSAFAFAQDELDAMRTAQKGHMLDTCVILSFSAETANEFGEYDAPAYDESQSTECGLDMRQDVRLGQERHGQDMTIINYDAILRLPIDIVVKETDRIRVTRRFGEALETALTYEIAAPIQRGPSGIRVRLRKVVV